MLPTQKRNSRKLTFAEALLLQHLPLWRCLTSHKTVSANPVSFLLWKTVNQMGVEASHTYHSATFPLNSESKHLDYPIILTPTTKTENIFKNQMQGYIIAVV